MLEARNLRKSFGELVATDDITLEFGKEEGELVFIVGPNGAGKTTFINLLTGFLSPDEGSIVLDGDDITGMSANGRVDAGIARSFQVVKVFEEMTVRENLRTVVLTEQGKTWSLFSMADGHAAVEEQVEELLEKFRLGDAANTVAEELPHGDRKLLDVAMSFGLDPDYLLLDEPTSGVSTREKEYVIETIVEVGRAEGVTTVTIEHDMDIVTEYADRVVALHQGAVHGVGPPTMLETDDELRRLLLGVGDDE
ncbi:ABC transporter ATP-binding protein [Haloarcula rubripromontorii]|uniref:ATP-binding cassette domain-containing protein n=1 Tax=Haloarcula rubripromontorii TaxID=1705562 RepID=A0A0M9AL39_9EURY|nr:ABC transporter ATP-binding protein [Haloarcula rubripromontorii]KOX92851.1 branched-chain amino acid ABC transporter ATP-binding protein [Haloarcula rubripromontorii]NLV06811.1 ATP-binding cassette domain-containing protein [Haloarcula rubripromontorii]